MSNEQPQKRNESELRALLNQIDAEYQSAMRAVRSFAYGTSQHRFITWRMERMRLLQELIADRVGETEASRLVSEQLDKSAQTPAQPDKPKES
jgi:hypothetical protein